MKLLQTLLIIFSLLIPFTSTGKHTMGGISMIAPGLSALSEKHLSALNSLSAGDLENRFVVNEKASALYSKKASGLYLYRLANSRRSLLKDAKLNPDHPRPKVSKKISKRKARKAKTS